MIELLGQVRHSAETTKTSVDPRLVAVPLIFACALLYVFTVPTYEFHFDSMAYWNSGRTFFTSGHFNFLDYRAEIWRGYFFPLLLGCLQHVADAMGCESQTLFLLFSSLSFALFAGAIVPSLYKALSGMSPSVLQIILFAAITFYFWHGYLLFPLTDLWAAYFLTLGCLLLLHCNELRNWLWAIAGFVFLSAAMLTRPAYLIAGVAVPLAVFIFHKLWRQPWFALCWLCSGALVISLFQAPQTYLNNVKPPIAKVTSLYEAQLSMGVMLEKYETTIGNDLAGMPQVAYVNPLGMGIIQREKLSPPFDLLTYLQILKKYPMEVMAIYGKHVINGLDVQFPEPYPLKIFTNRILFAFFNYCLLFFATTYILASAGARSYSRHTLVYLSLLSPVIPAVPAAVEPRFFLPVYLTVYGICSFAIMREPAAYFRRFRNYKMIAAFACAIYLAFTISSTTMKLIQPKPSPICFSEQWYEQEADENGSRAVNEKILILRFA